MGIALSDPPHLFKAEQVIEALRDTEHEFRRRRCETAGRRTGRMIGNVKCDADSLRIGCWKLEIRNDRYKIKGGKVFSFCS